MNHKIKIFFILPIVGIAGIASAQTPSEDRPKAIDEFIRNPLQRVMQSVQAPAQIKKDGISDTNIHAEKPIRNPFIPSFPEIRQNINKRTPVPDQKVPELSLPKTENKTTMPPAKNRPNFKIQGLVWNTQKPQAIIDDQVFNIGDTIESWTITAIEKSGISVSSESITFVIEP